MTFALVSAGGVMMTLDVTAVNIALPVIARDLHAGLPLVELTVSAYALAFGALLLTAGALCDRIGPRAVFLAGQALFALASAACGCAPDAVSLVGARTLQGVGGAMVFAPTLALLAAVFDDRTRPRAIAAYAVIASAAGALGPVLGGVLTELAGWRSIFLVNVPLGVAVVVGGLHTMPDVGARARDRRLDVVGAILATATLWCWHSALVLATRPDTAHIALGLAPVGVVLALLFARSQRRVGAMLDRSLLRNPSLAGAALLTLLARMSSLGVLSFVTLWLHGQGGTSPMQIGLGLLPLTGALLLVGLGVGRLQTRFAPAPLVGAGFVLHGAGLLLLADAEGAGVLSSAGLSLLGAGGAVIFPPLMNTAVEAAPPGRTGAAVGLTNACSPLGTALGVAVFGAILSLHLEAVVGAELSKTAARTVRSALEIGRLELVAPSARVVARTWLADAFSAVCLTAASVCALGTALSWRLLPHATTRRPATPPAVSPARGARISQPVLSKELTCRHPKKRWSP